MNETIKPPLLKLLMVITDWEKTEEIKNILRQSHVHMHYQIKAMGTANSEILDMFGLVNTEKALTFCLAPKPIAESLLYQISDAFSLRKKGKGIAFILPVSSAVAAVLSMLSKEMKQTIICHLENMESEAGEMKEEISYHLIISIINHGYSEELMEAAKSAGASGGTVIHARALGSEESLKFLGISVLPEKEMVFILTNQEHKADIMKVINQKCGFNTEAGGLLFAVPVDSIAAGRE